MLHVARKLNSKKIECLLLFKIRNLFKKGKCIISQFIKALNISKNTFFAREKKRFSKLLIINVKQKCSDYHWNPFKAIPTERPAKRKDLHS